MACGAISAGFFICLEKRAIICYRKGMLQPMLQKIKDSSFLRHNAILLAGSVLVGILNYAYYPILGRMLDVEAYGEVQALVSLFLQLTIFLTVLGQVTVNVVANYDDEQERQKVTFELEKVALFMSLAMFVLVAAFGWKLKAFFNFESVWPFMVVMVALVAAVPLNFRIAFLRGHKKFSETSIANLIGAAGKIALSALLVWAGWNTVGAIFGVVLAQVIAFGYAIYAARKAGFFVPPEGKRFSIPDFTLLKPELKYGILVLVGSLTVTVLSSVDIFIVKHYFDAETAGQYAGVSTVARMIYFLTASVAQVLLPSVKINQTPKQNRQFLIKSLALVCVLGGGALAVFTVFADQIITMLMGNEYTRYAHLLGTLSLCMFIISILNLLISYYIALRRYQIGAIVVLGAVIAGLLLMSHHGTLESVVNSLLYGSTGMLGMLVLWFVTRKTLRKMQDNDGQSTHQPKDREDTQ